MGPVMTWATRTAARRVLAAVAAASIVTTAGSGITTSARATAAGITRSAASGTPGPIAHPLRTAPEPAVSPPAKAHLPGTIVTLDGKPEGIAIDAAGEVGVNVRDPDGLVSFPLTDPSERQFLRTGGSARHLTLGATAGLFLVPDETDNTLVEVKLPSEQVVATVKVGHHPHDAIAVGPSTVFVADELANTIHIIVNGKVTRVVKAPLQPGGMAANPSGTRALVVGVRGRRIAEYTATGMLVGAANCGAGPTHAVTGNGGLYWVADTLGGAVLGFELGPKGPVQVATIPVGPRPYGLAFDGRTDTLWVTLTGADEVVGLHLRGTSVGSKTVFATPRQPNTVAVDQRTGEVVVAAATTVGSLQFLPDA
jgi:DNA-binding beta-propeller fold protein YncE